MNKSRNRLIRQRRRMRLEDPHCRLCGVLTILPEDVAKQLGRPLRKLGKFPDNMATIDHLRSRYHSCRVEPCCNGEVRRRLLCSKCNTALGLLQENEITLIKAAKYLEHYRLDATSSCSIV